MTKRLATKKSIARRASRITALARQPFVWNVCCDALSNRNPECGPRRFANLLAGCETHVRGSKLRARQTSRTVSHVRANNDLQNLSLVTARCEQAQHIEAAHRGSASRQRIEAAHRGSTSRQRIEAAHRGSTSRQHIEAAHRGQNCTLA